MSLIRSSSLELDVCSLPLSTGGKFGGPFDCFDFSFPMTERDDGLFKLKEQYDVMLNEKAEE